MIAVNLWIFAIFVALNSSDCLIAIAAAETAAGHWPAKLFENAVRDCIFPHSVELNARAPCTNMWFQFRWTWLLCAIVPSTCDRKLAKFNGILCINAMRALLAAGHKSILCAECVRYAINHDKLFIVSIWICARICRDHEWYSILLFLFVSDCNERFPFSNSRSHLGTNSKEKNSNI